MENRGAGGSCGGGGVVAQPAGSCSPAAGLSPRPRSREWLEPVKGCGQGLGLGGARFPGFGWALAAVSFRYFLGKGGSNPISS